MSAYTEDELRDLLDAAQQLDDLTAHPGWQRLREKMDEAAAATVKELEAGVDDWNAYVERIGYLSGVRHFLGLPAAVAAQAARARQT